MSKAIIWWIVGAVVVVGGGGYLIYSSSQGGNNLSNSANTATTTTTVTTTNTSAMNQQSFADVIKKGGSLKCTVSSNISGTNTSGTIYLNGGMMSGAYIVKVQGMSIDSNFIVRDGFTYTWSSLTPKIGYKTAIPAAGATSGTTANPNTFNASQVSSYNCQAWTPDLSKFTVPTNITFTLTGTK